MPEPTVLYEVESGVARIVLNRPEKLNAINGEMAEEMARIWARFEADEEARVALLSGAGRAFCAGQDLTPGAIDPNVPHQSHRAYPQNGRKVFKPIVAALHGHVAGAGFSLGVRGADITVAAESALFSFPEPRSGVPVPPLEFLPYMPFKISLEFMLVAWRDGRPMTARRAAHFGLVNSVTSDSDLMTEAESYCEMLLGIPPLYVRALKYGHYKSTRTQMSEHEESYFEFVYPQEISENSKEGLRAFLERDVPKFR